MKKRILITPLNWGLGHATRCIPIINALIAYGFEPVIASDGIALALLKKEYPDLEYIELLSYNITYPNKGSLKWYLLKEFLRISRIIKREKKLIEYIVAHNKIDGIISDNRFSAYSKKVPSVYITHQINVLSGEMTFFSSKWHQRIIANYDECWIPDNEDLALSGRLGDASKINFNTKYIGPLSRFENKSKETAFDLMVLLSGPEPQRSIFENILLFELNNYNGKVLFVKGIIEPEQTKKVSANITFYNYMTSNELENAINSSKLVLSRSGYSTVMDLAKLGKKAFFVPTPNQYEQEYLAKHLEVENIAPYCTQENFSVKKLSEIENYNGFNATKFLELPRTLFRLF